MSSTPHPYRRVKHFNEPFHAHELTFSCYHRRPYLSKDRACRYFVEAVTRARAKLPFHLWAYVVMPEHVHLLVWPCVEDLQIETLLMAVKQSVARRAISYLRRENPVGLELLSTGNPKTPYAFWQDGPGYDRNVYSTGSLRRVVDYIHNNPVRRGLVELADDWPWSSAADWSGRSPGILPLDKDSFPV